MSVRAYWSMSLLSGRWRQSDVWKRLLAFTLQNVSSRLARPNPPASPRARAAWPVSNMLTTYTPKSRCSHWISMSAPWKVFRICGSVVTMLSLDNEWKSGNGSMT